MSYHLTHVALSPQQGLSNGGTEMYQPCIDKPHKECTIVTNSQIQIFDKYMKLGRFVLRLGSLRLRCTGPILPPTTTLFKDRMAGIAATSL